MHGSLLLLGVSGPELTPDEAALFKRLQPAGYILFTRNIVTPQQTRKLTDDLRALSYDDPILAIDQEGGRVTRTKEIAPALPSAADLAAQGNPMTIANAGAFTADLLRLLGFNLNFAPVLDLDHHPEVQNSLRGRCWGRDPQRVIDHAGMWNRWLRKRSVKSCGKHFPACGRALSDPHHDLPSSDATLAELLREDVLPYTALMPELDSIMVAHVEFPNIDPEHPASMSKRIITGFLRDQLGFDKHVVLTDDLDMGAITKRYGRGEDVRRAIEAGNDLAMICHQIETADTAVEALKTLPIHVIDESLKRVTKLRKKMVAPITWSEKKWQETCDAIAKLAATVPAAATQSGSPVADY
ncbi:beta-N-acetylhexosaminidase [Luteolibacter sp. LG18]|uniref:beta-N-acetylhexosaminidase n=1 Tax=Luteolibacter sp. LG18 TaxID=2819286 RepID=UPI002B2AF00D|nr:beta-hexosaminidase [Luteolibacter sp. LG18]